MNKSYHKPARGRRVSLPLAFLDRVAEARIPDSARAVLFDMLPIADDRGRIDTRGLGYFERPDGTHRTRPWAAIERAAGHLIQARIIERVEWVLEAEGHHIQCHGFRLLGAR